MNFYICLLDVVNIVYGITTNKWVSDVGLQVTYLSAKHSVAISILLITGLRNLFYISSLIFLSRSQEKQFEIYVCKAALYLRSS